MSKNPVHTIAKMQLIPIIDQNYYVLVWFPEAVEKHSLFDKSRFLNTYKSKDSIKVLIEGMYQKIRSNCIEQAAIQAFPLWSESIRSCWKWQGKETDKKLDHQVVMNCVVKSCMASTDLNDIVSFSMILIHIKEGDEWQCSAPSLYSAIREFYKEVEETVSDPWIVNKQIDLIEKELIEDHEGDLPLWKESLKLFLNSPDKSVFLD